METGRVLHRLGSGARLVGMVLAMSLVQVSACAGEKKVSRSPAKVERTSISPDSQPSEQSAAAPATPNATPASSQPGQDLSADRGAQLFAKHCFICHGEKGDGAGKFAYLMNPRPRNFQKEAFKLYTTQNQVPSEDDLLRTVSRGMPGSAMPPWGHLPSADLQALVRFVRETKRRAVEQELQEKVTDGKMSQEEMTATIAERCDPGPAIMVPPEPPFDELHWFRGRRLYLQSCASCHGTDGRPVASEIKLDEQGYPVPPRSFVDGIFKGGSEGHQLYVRIMKGMRGTPMPSNEDSIKSDEAWDLIHYVQSLARAGAQERAQLRMGTIVAPALSGPLPDGPQAPEWNQSRSVYVALTPLWWTDERIEGLLVQALHNEKEVAFRLSWIDASEDTRAVRQDEFRDGVAIQFSLSPDPPFYMGSAGPKDGVNIWYWKADRQKDLTAGRQDVRDAHPNQVVDQYQQYEDKPTADSGTQGSDQAVLHSYLTYLTAWASGNLVANPTLKTSVESLVAHGPGTLSGKPPNIQLVDGKAIFERGVWTVQMQRNLDLLSANVTDTDQRVFKPGDYLPVSFAVWNGSAGDRDGKKNISIWQKLVIE